MSLPKVLVVNTVCPGKNCGIHQHGLRFYSCLKESTVFDFVYCEANSTQSLAEHKEDYVATIFNFIPISCDWQVDTHFPNLGKRLAIAHECTQKVIDNGSDERFDLWLVSDATINVGKTNFRVVPRPLAGDFKETEETPGPPRIGSFGFPVVQKGFPDVVAAVCAEFDEAIVSLHMPQAEICEAEEWEWKTYLRRFKRSLRRKISKSGVRIEATYDFISDSELIKRLSKNHLNVFLYNDDLRGIPREFSGVSSTMDYAIPAGRPILVSESTQFRHVHGILPQYPFTSLKQAIEGGTDSVRHLSSLWSKEEHLKRIEGIISNHE